MWHPGGRAWSAEEEGGVMSAADAEVACVRCGENDRIRWAPAKVKSGDNSGHVKTGVTSSRSTHQIAIPTD